MRGVILVSLENASFHMVYTSLENASFHMVYTINWFKKCQHINYCSHAEQLTFNCHKGEGRIMAQLFILLYSYAVSFRDIRAHLGTITSIDIAF